MKCKHKWLQVGDGDFIDNLNCAAIDWCPCCGTLRLSMVKGSHPNHIFWKVYRKPKPNKDINLASRMLFGVEEN